MTKFLFHSQNPTENYKRSSSSLKAYFFAIVIVSIVMLTMKGVSIGLLSFFLLSSIGVFEMYCAKSMLKVTDYQDLAKAYKNGMYLKRLFIGLLCIYWIFIFEWYGVVLSFFTLLGFACFKSKSN